MKGAEVKTRKEGEKRKGGGRGYDPAWKIPL